MKKILCDKDGKLLSTPKMNSENYEALKRDIEMNGQIDPITVYRGKIIMVDIDG